MNSNYKSRWLSILSTIGVLFILEQIALGYPNPPTCVVSSWQGDTQPIVVLVPMADQTEPATIGQSQSITRSVFVTIIPGSKHRIYMCDDGSSSTETGVWQANFTAGNWVCSGATPSSGILEANCSFYSATFTPPQQGGAITFSAKITPVDPAKPGGDGTISGSLTIPISALSPMRLGYWKFNDSTWTGEQGQTPNVADNIANVADWHLGAWNGGALEVFLTRVLSPNTFYYSKLGYSSFRPDGMPNITRNIGTIRFWYRPDWTTGSGTGYVAKLFEMNNLFPQWNLAVDAKGQNITLISQSDSCGSSPVTHLTRPIYWTAGQWYQIVVTYSAGGVAIYVDGSLLGSSSNPITTMENAVSSFTIGNGADGTSPATGLYDELETFNYVLSASDIAADYQQASSLDSDGDGIPNLQELASPPPNGPTDPYNPDTDGDGVWDGVDCFPLNPNAWDCGPYDPNPPVIQILQPVNAVPVN
jgi:Concanavalin A-like lectin/glucanases superfamily